MYDTQLAIIDHLKKSDLLKTVKPYGGEFREAAKLRAYLPAVFVMFMTGNPGGHLKNYRFDLLVVNETRILDRQKNVERNMELTQQVAEYLLQNWHWNDGTHYYSFEQDANAGISLEAETLLVDPKFTITVLRCQIHKQ